MCIFIIHEMFSFSFFRAQDHADSWFFFSLPLTSKPPLYLSQPLSRILSPRISKNLSKPGLALSESTKKTDRSKECAAVYYWCLFIDPCRRCHPRANTLLSVHFLQPPLRINCSFGFHNPSTHTYTSSTPWLTCHGFVDFFHILPFESISSSVVWPSFAYMTPNLKFTEPSCSSNNSKSWGTSNGEHKNQRLDIDTYVYFES